MLQRNIWRAAALLVREQGDDAEWTAAQNADTMIARGDNQGCAAWLSLCKERTREGEAVN